MIRVLIADDSAFMRKVLSDLFTEAPDFEVAGVAFNGKDAVEKALRLKPDLLTMDVNMPVMDGLQATMKIRSYARQDAQSLPIIALTANALDEEEHICLEAGMNARLTKPINPQKLYQALVKYIQALPQEN